MSKPTVPVSPSKAHLTDPRSTGAPPRPRLTDISGARGTLRR